MKHEPIMNPGTGRSYDLPRHVYLRRGKYHYFEKKGQKPIRLHAAPGTAEFNREYRLAMSGFPDREPTESADVVRRRVYGGFHTTKGYCLFAEMETAAKKRAVQLGREYSLPRDWAKSAFDAQDGRCALSGMLFKKDRPRRAPFAPSIDRMDPKKGYTPDNCQLVAYIVNCAKNQFTVEEFVTMCRSVVAMHPAPERPLRKRATPAQPQKGEADE